LLHPDTYLPRIKMPERNSQKTASNSDSEEYSERVFQEELWWCIDYLEENLRIKKLSEKQTKSTIKTISWLKNSNIPYGKKRQLMRVSCGDYRAKMAKEDEEIWIEDDSDSDSNQSDDDESAPPPPKQEVMPRKKCFEILEIPESSREDEIKSAYLKLARKWHPDKNPNASEETAKKFKDILEAYETLTRVRKEEPILIPIPTNKIMEPNECLTVLGLTKSANETQVKEAYLKMAKKWHPDRNTKSAEEASDKFKKVLEAYETLSGVRKPDPVRGG